MRYLIQFSDKTTKRITEAEAEGVKKALSAGRPIILRGAYLSPHYVLAVKPISTKWFDRETVEAELPPSVGHKTLSDAKLLGIEDMRMDRTVTVSPKMALLAKLSPEAK